MVVFVGRFEANSLTCRTVRQSGECWIHGGVSGEHIGCSSDFQRVPNFRRTSPPSQDMDCITEAETT